MRRSSPNPRSGATRRGSRRRLAAAWLAAAIAVSVAPTGDRWAAAATVAARTVVTTIDAEGRPHFATFAPGQATAAALPGRVVAVAPDRRVAALGSSDPWRSLQWNLDVVRFEDAWPYTDGTGTVVAVLDTGVTTGHVDLQGRLLAGAHFLHDAGNLPVSGEGGVTDGHGHGTHVSGTIAALARNDVGIAGLAPGVRILPVKVLSDTGSGWMSDIAAGIVWATDQGADVINLSLGAAMSGSDPATEAALAYATLHGVFVAAAAGNDGCTVGGACSAVYPASSPYAVAVGAIETAIYGSTDEMRCADYTTRAPYVALGAPGSNIMATYRNMGANGNENANYAGMSGTSMATPHVAAAAALVRAVDPDATPLEIEQLLRQTARTMGIGASCVGSGVIDPEAAVIAAGGALSPPAPPTPPGPTPPSSGDPAAPTSSAFHSVGPVRVLDTRPTATPLGAGDVRTVDVRSLPGFEQATAVALSLTGIDRGAGGYLTAYGSGNARPTASSLNLGRGAVRTNALIVPVGPDGRIAVFAQGAADLVIDLTGAFVPAVTSTSGRLEAITPSRVLDTRPVDGAFASGETRTVDLRASGIPADAVAAVVSLTTTGSRAGYWAAWRSGDAWGGTSTLNVAGDPTTISAIVPVADGRIEVRSQTGGHLVVDVGGWFTGPSAPDRASGLFVPQVPTRLMDTRGTTSLAPEAPLRFDNPGAAAAIAVNLTVVDPPSVTFLTVYDADHPRPLASAANASAGDVTATGVIGPVAPGGWFLFSQVRTDVVVDATGYFLA